MAVSKSVIVLLALVAVAAAAETARVKKQVILAGAYPYVAPVAPLVKAVVPPAPVAGEDDGSWAPNKYDPVEVPVAAPLAAPLAYPYAAPFAYPYAAPFPYAYSYPWVDDGYYFPGKYGPETQ